MRIPLARQTQSRPEQSSAASTPTRIAGKPPLRACLRVAAYVAAVVLAVGYGTMRAAYADAELALGRLGHVLVDQLGPDVLAAPEVLSVNGQRLYVASRQSALSVQDVLDRFADQCRARRGQGAFAPLGAGVAESPQPAPDRARAMSRLLEELSHPMRLGVLRHEGAGQGHLVCFERPADRAGLGDLITGLGELAETGDLSRLGAPRYVSARRLENQRTHVLTVWSEGPLELGALISGAGDAPGADLPDVPRPPDTVRLLSARVAGRTLGLWLYDAIQTRDQVLAFYDRALPAAGFEPVHGLPDATRPAERVAMRAFTKNGRALAIGVSRDLRRPGVGSSISLVDLGAVRQTVARRHAGWLE